MHPRIAIFFLIVFGIISSIFTFFRIPSGDSYLDEIKNSNSCLLSFDEIGKFALGMNSNAYKEEFDAFSGLVQYCNTCKSLEYVINECDIFSDTEWVSEHGWLSSEYNVEVLSRIRDDFVEEINSTKNLLIQNIIVEIEFYSIYEEDKKILNIFSMPRIESHLHIDFGTHKNIVKIDTILLIKCIIKNDSELFKSLLDKVFEDYSFLRQKT